MLLTNQMSDLGMEANPLSLHFNAKKSNLEFSDLYEEKCASIYTFSNVIMQSAIRHPHGKDPLANNGVQTMNILGENCKNVLH